MSIHFKYEYMSLNKFKKLTANTLILKRNQINNKKGYNTGNRYKYCVVNIKLNAIV